MGIEFGESGEALMPQIEIALEPIAVAQAELAREIGQLEADGKRILDI